MLDRKDSFDRDIPPPEDPQAMLERSYIQAFLKTKGLSIQDLAGLPEDIAKALMTEASKYASSKLVEVEMRSKLIHDLHGEG